MKQQPTSNKHNRRAILKRIETANRYKDKIRAHNIAFNSGRKTTSPQVRQQIEAPEKICLYTRGRHAKLITFIKKLRNATLKNNTKVKIDFSQTTLCGASGMLLLLAEIDRILRICDTEKMLIGCNVKDLTVRQVFKQTGFGKMLHIKDNIEITNDDVKHWCYITGEGTEGSIVGELADRLAPQIGEEISSEMFGAYVDAIDNVAGHAYV